MKYKTITFDANRPVVKQITEPLDSDYGIALKVYKDRQTISADLSVGETVCTDWSDGWKFAELSSGNVPTMKKLDVIASNEDDFYATFSLYVQEKDLGYIEVNDISTEPEPTPDPEEPVEQTEG